VPGRRDRPRPELIRAPAVAVEDVALALAADTAQTVGGALFAAFFVAGLVVGQFTSGLAAQASVSRLLYAMGRDGVLPRGSFGRLSGRFATPVFNLV
jgi:amino acid transporter